MSTETCIQFPTDYPSIVARIEQINPVQYAQTRNFTSGAVTYLLPYLSRGVISVKQVQDRLIAKGYTHETAGKLLQELAWREYFQRVWQAKGDAIQLDLKNPQTNVKHNQMVSALMRGDTGILAIDQAIQAFYQTGYLHNHIRMYIASIACNLAQAQWSAPARWMYFYLLDGDVASNTCSWQWVAGSFASKKYYCNQDNINRFTNSQQHNTFLDLDYEQLLHADVPEVMKGTESLTLSTSLPNTKAPLIDQDKPTLVYNSYNLDPLWRKDEDVNRILLLEPSHFRQYPVHGKVLQFVLDLAQNIHGIQCMVGEISDLVQLVGNGLLISKEHPAFNYYPGAKDNRDWIYPSVSGYHPSFSAFWKKCEQKLLRHGITN